MTEFPECRSHNDAFSAFLGLWSYIEIERRLKINESYNMSLMDCEAKCFYNCSCVAYASAGDYAQTGCVILSRRPSINSAVDSDQEFRTIYILNLEGKSD